MVNWDVMAQNIEELRDPNKPFQYQMPYTPLHSRQLQAKIPIGGWKGLIVTCTEYCNMNEQREVMVFRLLRKAAGEVWYKSLTDDLQQNWEELQEGFTEKFIVATTSTD